MRTETRARLSEAVAVYADRLHTEIGAVHHVASPLGAWLLLALTGAAARGAEAERLREALGMPTTDAAQCARELLDHPDPVVAAAVAAWVGGRSTLSEPAQQWLAGLPQAVEHGPIPSQADADAWARKHTLDMIEHFPLRLAGWSMVLTSALATKINWSTAFATTDSSMFRSDWRDRVTSVLRTPEQGHEMAIARHSAAGDIAVHRASASGLRVTSVIAAPDVPARVVLAAAHDAARDQVRRYALADLPLGEGHAWTLTTNPGQHGPERIAAVLPAWSATSKHDLRAPSLGFCDAAQVLGRLFAAPRWTARQAAVARYDRTGFSAAAVTVVAVAVSLFLGEKRAALLRFDRPYAVVATATGSDPWADLPVFSAWVTEPKDAA